MFHGLNVHERFIQGCWIDAKGRTRRGFRIDATADAASAFATGLSRPSIVSDDRSLRGPVRGLPAGRLGRGWDRSPAKPR